jgi:hypothetical protein
MPTTRGGALRLEELRPVPPRRRRATTLVLVVLAVAVVLAGAGGVRALLHSFERPQCQATALGNSVTFDPAQTGHAATITAVAVRRGLPPRAATIAIATAIQESKLRNLRYGDRDSVGLFQQRPSQGWGTAEQILDPSYATNRFYDALVRIEGYQSMEITKVAQQVQRSAYPEAYADHEQEGRILASALSGHSPGGLGCRIDPAPRGDPAGFTAQLESDLGLRTQGSEATLTVLGRDEVHAWGIGAWAVAKAEATGIQSVQVGDRLWSRTRDKTGWQWRPATAKVPPATVRVTFAR